MIARWKMIKIGFIKTYISSGIGGGGYLALVNYQSLLSNLLPLAPLILSSSINYSRIRLLHESFIELPIQDFMIYQLVNKRTEIRAIATFHSDIAHFCNYYNHVLALLISLPRFNSINFYQCKPKFKLFKTIQNFRALGVLPPDPLNSPLPLQISGYAPDQQHHY